MEHSIDSLPRKQSLVDVESIDRRLSAMPRSTSSSEIEPHQTRRFPGLHGHTSTTIYDTQHDTAVLHSAALTVLM